MCPFYFTKMLWCSISLWSLTIVFSREWLLFCRPKRIFIWIIVWVGFFCPILCVMTSFDSENSLTFYCNVIKLIFFIIVYVQLVTTHMVTSYTRVPKTAAVGIPFCDSLDLWSAYQCWSKLGLPLLKALSPPPTTVSQGNQSQNTKQTRTRLIELLFSENKMEEDSKLFIQLPALFEGLRCIHFSTLVPNNLPLSSPNRPVSKTQSAIKSIYWRLKSDLQDCLSLSFWCVQWPCKSIWLLKPHLKMYEFSGICKQMTLDLFS